MKTCTATNRIEFLIDDAEYEEVITHTWTEHNGALYTRIGNNIVNLARFLLNCPKGLEVDHIDHNRLNNQKNNLRICTSQQNNMNRCKSLAKSSKYKGVSWKKEKHKWEVYIKLNHKIIHLGRFMNEIDAAKTYNKAAIELFGEFAFLNEVI